MAEMERFWHIGRDNSNPWRGRTLLRPRVAGPFIRSADDSSTRELVIGMWSLIPWFATTSKLTFSTCNARFEEISTKASFKQPWQRQQRCIIPAESFDEPCWESGKNVWWRFRRSDSAPWGLAGLWNRWIDKTTGEAIESYTMLTTNADGHPLMSRMHKPNPKLPSDRQDKRSVVAIALADVELWLQGSNDEAAELVRPPALDVLDPEPGT